MLQMRETVERLVQQQSYSKFWDLFFMYIQILYIMFIIVQN